MTRSEPSEELTILLEEYRILWSYYQRVFDERKELFNWYFKIVALPAGIIGSFTAALFFSEETADLERARESLATGIPLACALLSVVFMAGLGLLATYARQSRNGLSYLDGIKSVRRYLRATYEDIAEVLWVPALDGEPHVARLTSVPFLRVLGLMIVNSAIGTSATLLGAASAHLYFASARTVATLLIFSVALLGHCLLYQGLARWRTPP